MRRPDPTIHARRLLRGAIALLAAATLAACSDSTGNDDEEVVETSELGFLRLAEDAPPFPVITKTFVAVKGQDRELRLYHSPVGDDSTEFLRFRVRDDALWERPDGSRFANGESVTITVTVVDLANLIVDFQPAGLRFNPSEPAELKFEFSEADDDIDDDGDVDGSDESIEQVLAIWRRESPTQPWVQLSSVVEVELDEIEAEIHGFTNYAIAYRR
jgi:hypothetical protein